MVLARVPIMPNDPKAFSMGARLASCKTSCGVGKRQVSSGGACASGASSTRISRGIVTLRGVPNCAAMRPARVLALLTEICWPSTARHAISKPS